jgi:hypothetical protein
MVGTEGKQMGNILNNPILFFALCFAVGFLILS